MPQQPPELKKAKIRSLSGQTIELEVHFNPATLVYTVENASSQQAADPKRRQTVAHFTGKLTMDLQFDTTDNGDDVRKSTHKLASLMKASADAQLQAGAAQKGGTPPQAQPVVQFEWGVYSFRGTLDSFRETLDFFSGNGVPLRALVSISMSQQDIVFDDAADTAPVPVSGSLVPTSAGDSALSAATRGGAPSAARQLASDNGLESLRFTGGASLQVNAGVQLNAAAGFAASASAGAGLGISGGAGLGVSAGAGISAGGGAVFGAKASAGVSASEGAFAGLETGRATTSSTTQLNPMRMLPATVGADISAHAGATFSLGGYAQNETGAGLSADTGATFSFRERLTFDSDD